MAFRSVKRPATALAGNAKTRRKTRSSGARTGPATSLRAAARDGLISRELLKSGLPSPGVARMLASMLKRSLGTSKDKRGSFQQEVVDMIQEALDARETALKASVEAAECQIADLREESERQKSTVPQLQQDVQACEEAMAERQKALARSAEKLRAAERALKGAEVACKKSDRVHEKSVQRKEKVDQVLTTYRDLSATRGDAKTVRGFQAACKAFGIDMTTVEALPMVANKEPAARGPFDLVVLDQLGEALEKISFERAAEMEAEEPERRECEQTMESFVQLRSRTSEKHDVCEAERSAAAGSLEEARAALARTKQAIRNTDEMDKALAERIGAVTTLEAFQAGPLAAFQELKDLQTPVLSEDTALGDAAVLPGQDASLGDAPVLPGQDGSIGDAAELPDQDASMADAAMAENAAEAEADAAVCEAEA